MGLNENIKKKRCELKLSQEYIAEQLGVSRQAVSKWETGQSEPTAKNLVELANLFQISLSELVSSEQVSKEQKKKQKKPNLILRTNLSMLAIIFQAGFLFASTQISYKMVDGKEIIDHQLRIINIIFLCICSIWMIGNLMLERDAVQRRKNVLFEFLYCFIQLMIALCTFYIKLGMVGLLLMLAVLLFYILYVNPKYMNRPFGKKQK